MLSEAELAAEIEADEGKPKLKRYQPKAEPVPTGDPKRKVWIKCITENKPWCDEKPLDFWNDYLVNEADAKLLEHRKQAVILETPKKGN